jgi:hypothetical protein
MDRKKASGSGRFGGSNRREKSCPAGGLIGDENALFLFVALVHKLYAANLFDYTRFSRFFIGKN